MVRSVRSIHPGPRARDPRSWRVEIREDAVRWPIVLHFARWDEGGESRWVNVAFELRRAVDEIDKDTRLEDVPEIDPATLERIAVQYHHYLAIALAELDFERTARDVRIERLRSQGRGRAGLTDEFYRLIAEEHREHRRRGRPPGRTIARHYHTHESAVSRWLKRARELGYLDDEEGSR